MRGRKPTPTHLKAITGNPGKRPINHAEPRPDIIIPTARPNSVRQPGASGIASSAIEVASYGERRQREADHFCNPVIQDRCLARLPRPAS